MNEFNFRPAPIETPEDFLRDQKNLLMKIPARENARRARQRRFFFGSVSAFILAGAMSAILFGSSDNISADQNLDYYYSSLSDADLQHTIRLADADPFFEVD